jgi:hypothetical protein
MRSSVEARVGHAQHSPSRARGSSHAYQPCHTQRWHKNCNSPRRFSLAEMVTPKSSCPAGTSDAPRTDGRPALSASKPR